MQDITNWSDKDRLEMAVDSIGLHGVLEMLAEIAGEKAEHIRTNWPTAKDIERGWNRDAKRLDKLAAVVRRESGK